MAENKTVLIVDDEPDVVTWISTLLEDNGYSTVSAQNGEEALNRIKDARPDLVTLDISMPGTSGVRFYRDMKENDEWKAIPIVVVTGISDDFKQFISTRRQVPPPEGYISKPIEEKEILELVKKLIG
jgi:CheY-like chemotaxis protein